MSLTVIAPPYPVFTDTNGKPLDDGYIYIGEVSQDPSANPIQVYWDSDLSIPASQPISTLNGYPSRRGTAAQLYADTSSFSIMTKDKHGSLVMYSPVGYGIVPTGISGSVQIQRYSGDGATTVFTLPFDPESEDVMSVYVSGVHQSHDTFSLSGTALTFSEAPPEGTDNIEVILAEPVSLGYAESDDINYVPEGSSTALALSGRLDSRLTCAGFGVSGEYVDNLSNVEGFDGAYFIALGKSALNDGGEGTFIFDSSDLSTEVAADSYNGIYVAPASDSSGTSGAWKRVYSGAVNVKWFGVVSDGTADDSIIINGIITSGFKNIVIEDTTCYLENSVNIESDMTITGKNGKLLVNSSTDLDIFSNTGDIENVTIDGISFEGNYFPEDRLTSRLALTQENTAIHLENAASGIVIKNCDFYMFTYGGIWCDLTSGYDISIYNNTFNNANYRWKAISVYGETQSSPTVKKVSIRENIIKNGGVLCHLDASQEDAGGSSVDGIHIDIVKNANISHNTIESIAGIGIRVEQSKFVSVSNNNLREIGQDGIDIYYESHDITVEANVIEKVGYLLNTYLLRSYGGSYYHATEFPTAALIPASPVGADIWVENTYAIPDDVTGILTYAEGDEYTGLSSGILPFRGYSGIAFNSSAYNVSICGNVIILDDATDGNGDYYYGSNYGIALCHSLNSPTGASEITVSNNTVREAISTDIHLPRYMDTFRAEGPFSSVKESGNIYSTIEKPYTVLANAPESNSITLTPAGGSISADTYLHFKKENGLCYVTGKLYVASVSSPTGQLTLNVPDEFKPSKDSVSQPMTVVNADVGGTAYQFVTLTTTDAIDIDAVDITSGTLNQSVSPLITATTRLYFNFVYPSY